MAADFTLSRYRRYLEAIQATFGAPLKFDEWLRAPRSPTRFCLIRHDVDRRPDRALRMARLEAERGIHASYYFRSKAGSFAPPVIRSIAQLGHEIGYHYECLSDCGGDLAGAYRDFTGHLQRLRECAEVSTVSMHGRPLSRYDNRDLFRDPEYHDRLIHRLGVLGEIYLDIDYRDICYISDTGRNWYSSRANIRDQVESDIVREFSNGDDLLAYLRGSPHPRMVFQIHPERWTDTALEWSMQTLKDGAVNGIKVVLRLSRMPYLHEVGRRMRDGEGTGCGSGGRR